MTTRPSALDGLRIAYDIARDIISPRATWSSETIMGALKRLADAAGKVLEEQEPTT